VLTVTEVALALVLLAASGLLVRSFAKMLAVDPGFQPSHIVAGVVRFPNSKYPNVDQARAAVDELLSKVRSIPGVQAATIGSDLPLTTNWQSTVSFESRPEPDASKLPLVNAVVVDPTYFQTLEIPLVAGRRLTTADGHGQPLVVVIGERIAKKFFAAVNPIGQRMKLGQASDTSSWRTIVGVVKDTRTDGLTEEPRGTFYMPRAQEEMRGGWLMVRASIPAEQLTALLRHAVAEVDPDMPLAQVRTMDAVLDELVEGPRFSMLLLTIFAGVALALASIGIYGVISYNVTQRTNEIGVRMALGAQRRDVVRLVVTHAMIMVGIGILLGLGLALLGGRSLSSMLFGVGPRDPLVLSLASAFLLAVALIAALAPALRASRIDPTMAIRAD
jgi:predicted permease